MMCLTVSEKSEDSVKELARCTPAAQLAPTHGSPAFLLHQDGLFSCNWKGALKLDFVRVVQSRDTRKIDGCHSGLKCMSCGDLRIPSIHAVGDDGKLCHTPSLCTHFLCHRQQPATEPPKYGDSCV